MSEPVTIHLSRDEALVLFEFFARFDEDDLFRLRNNAEFIAFMHVASQLEKALVEPFQSNYLTLLASARAQLAEGYEGLAPGVEPE
jgi:hypothetical protein